LSKTRQVVSSIAVCLGAAAIVASRAIASPFAEASKSVVQLTSGGSFRGSLGGVSDNATGVVIALPDGERCLLASCRCLSLTSSALITAHFRTDGELRRASARLVGDDPSTDLLVLNADEIEAPAALLAEAGAPEVGEKLYLVATGPKGALEFAESIVTETDLHGVGVMRYERLTRVSSSQQVRLGSAAFDEKGRLFGFVVHKTRTTEPRPVTYVYVNPVSAWSTTIERLRESGEITRPWLGLLLVQERDESDAKNGARVKSVLPDSPASRAGVQVNDVIVGYESGGTQSIICCITDLTFAIADLEPGASIGLNVARGEERLQLPVQLEAMPEKYISGKPAPEALRPRPRVTFPSPRPPSSLAVRRKTFSLDMRGPLHAVALNVYYFTKRPIHIHKDVDPAMSISFHIRTSDPAEIERSFIRVLERLGLSIEIADEVVRVRKGE